MLGKNLQKTKMIKGNTKMNKIVITLLLAGSQLFSSTYVGVVKDASTGSPIADANIIISGNKKIGLTSNEVRKTLFHLMLSLSFYCH
jgi:hypothetical protein